MAENEPEVNPMLMQLVFSLQSAAWYQMGKMASPVTGKVERDLQQAKISIDLLVMLQEKTSGNLTKDEKQLLDSAVYNLQMNYVDEAKKGDDKTDNESDDTPQPTESEEGSEDEPGMSEPGK